jgi:hypothetical protein
MAVQSSARSKEISSFARVSIAVVTTSASPAEREEVLNLGVDPSKTPARRRLINPAATALPERIHKQTIEATVNFRWQPPMQAEG